MKKSRFMSSYYTDSLCPTFTSATWSLGPSLVLWSPQDFFLSIKDIPLTQKRITCAFSVLLIVTFCMSTMYMTYIHIHFSTYLIILPTQQSLDEAQKAQASCSSLHCSSIRQRLDLNSGHPISKVHAQSTLPCYYLTCIFISYHLKLLEGWFLDMAIYHSDLMQKILYQCSLHHEVGP